MGAQTGQVGGRGLGGLGWPSNGLLWALSFAVVYALAFELNRFFDPLFSVLEAKVSLIFLPAFIRVAAVLVAGAAGALGLFLGSLILGVIQDLPIALSLVQAFLTALAPCLALLVIRYALAGRALGITLSLFLLLALFASIFNSLLHHIFWDFYPFAESVTLTTFWQMLVGDLSGALLGFGVFALIVRLLRALSHPNPADST
jgi:hypothetical protein